MNQTYIKYAESIEAAGGETRIVLPTQRRELMQSWRKFYSMNLYIKANKWQLHEYDWHVFSYGYSLCYSGQEAIAEYSSTKVNGPFFVIPHDQNLDALEIIGGEHPNLLEYYADVYVFGSDFNWTMVYTHEYMNFGPYFSKKEWLLQ